ncbi:MAG: hypothetical protein ABSA09_09195 [Desulfobaccales bacterium]|jgi:hypothetical protein
MPLDQALNLGGLLVDLMATALPVFLPNSWSPPLEKEIKKQGRDALCLGKTIFVFKEN